MEQQDRYGSTMRKAGRGVPTESEEPQLFNLLSKAMKDGFELLG